MIELQQSDIDKFWTLVQPGTELECWNWLGGHSNGYGTFRLISQSIDIHAHRVMYYLETGIWSDKNFVIDHKCRNRGCVNYSHLHRTTRTGNGYNTNPRISCPNGHIYTVDSYKIVSGKHVCIPCESARHQRYYDKIGDWKREKC